MTAARKIVDAELGSTSRRLALGTVQFGMAYGVVNAQGQVTINEVGRILQVAAAAGIDTLDTAALYGTSEQVLGEVGTGDMRIVSKLPQLPPGADIAGWVETAARESCRRLGVTSLYALLLHRPNDLLTAKGPALYAALCDLRRTGLVGKIGYSVYAPADLDALVPAFPPDLVQIPYNVFDRRMRNSGWLDRLSAAGVEVHARSAFLQGLLLCAADAVPAKFAPWSGTFSAWSQWCATNGLSQLEAALGHSLGTPGIDRVVIGVESADQLSGILAAATGLSPAVPAAMEVADLALIDPSQWGKL